MSDGKTFKYFLTILVFLTVLVNAQMFDNVKSFICTIYDAFETIGGTFITIMFLYGGLRYVYGAGDPANRKIGKSICIHAIIGGIIIVLADGFISTVGKGFGFNTTC